MTCVTVGASCPVMVADGDALLILDDVSSARVMLIPTATRATKPAPASIHFGRLLCLSGVFILAPDCESVVSVTPSSICISLYLAAILGKFIVY